MTRPNSPGLLRAGLEVAGPGTRQFLRGKGILGAGALLAVTVVIALLVNEYSSDAPIQDFRGLQLVLLVPVVVPLIALILGTAAMATERENGTLPYLFTRPVRRASVVLGKGAGAILVTSALVIVGVLLVWIVGGAPGGANLPAVLVALLLEALALTSLFILFGTVIPRSIFAGLAYVALYEGFLGTALGENPYSLGYHVRGLLYHWTSDSFAAEFFTRPPPPATESVLTLLGVAVACLALAALWVETREYGLRDRPKEE